MVEVECFDGSQGICSFNAMLLILMASHSDGGILLYLECEVGLHAVFMCYAVQRTDRTNLIVVPFKGPYQKTPYNLSTSDFRISYFMSIGLMFSLNACSNMVGYQCADRKCVAAYRVLLQKYVSAYDLGDLSGLIIYIPVLDSVPGT